MENSTQHNSELRRAVGMACGDGNAALPGKLDRRYAGAARIRPRPGRRHVAAGRRRIGEARVRVPEAERALLAERLLESLGPELEELTEDELAAELDRRRAEIDVKLEVSLTVGFGAGSFVHASLGKREEHDLIACSGLIGGAVVDRASED